MALDFFDGRPWGVVEYSISALYPRLVSRHYDEPEASAVIDELIGKIPDSLIETDELSYRVVRLARLSVSRTVVVESTFIDENGNRYKETRSYPEIADVGVDNQNNTSVQEYDEGRGCGSPMCAGCANGSPCTEV